jgi:hypothetical protein
VPIDGGQRLETVRRLRNDLDARYLLELVAQFFTRELLIVHDDHAQRSHSADPETRREP